MSADMMKTIGNALALAMGVAVIVTNIVAPMSLAGVTTLLAVGLVALGVMGLQK
jgi:hypothetical protein